MITWQKINQDTHEGGRTLPQLIPNGSKTAFKDVFHSKGPLFKRHDPCPFLMRVVQRVQRVRTMPFSSVSSNASTWYSLKWREPIPFAKSKLISSYERPLVSGRRKKTQNQSDNRGAHPEEARVTLLGFQAVGLMKYGSRNRCDDGGQYSRHYAPIYHSLLSEDE